MQTRLLFLTNQYSRQPTLDALSRMELDCITKVVTYDSFEHIPQVYRQHADDCDAVLISGTSAGHILEMIFPNNPKPVVAYQVDSDALHRDILLFAIETQNLDFSRIAVDFLLPLGGGYSVVDFLKLDTIQHVLSQNARMTEQTHQQSGQSMELRILDQIVALWEQGAIDMVLCLYASIVPMLQERGIPFRCPFISDGHLRRLIQDVLGKIELSRLHGSHPAIVQIFPRQIGSVSETQFRQLFRCVSRYVHDNHFDGVLQETENCCVLISSMQILRFLTNDFQVCRLTAHLENHLDFPVAVGYGIGTSVSHAMNNVQIASKEAKLTGKSFVVDSNGNLIGPLNSENRMVIAHRSLPDVSELARRCSLSAMTIQKLQRIVQNNGSDKLTVPEMAERMNTTIRNANRIMGNLCRGEVAKPVYTKTTHSRGRPIQVYALDFGSRQNVTE